MGENLITEQVLQPNKLNKIRSRCLFTISNLEVREKLRTEEHLNRIVLCIKMPRQWCSKTFLHKMAKSQVMVKSTKDFLSYKWVKILLSNLHSSQICSRCSLVNSLSSSSNCLQMVVIKCNLNRRCTSLRSNKSSMVSHQSVPPWFLIIASNSLIKDLIQVVVKQLVNRE